MKGKSISSRSLLAAIEACRGISSPPQDHFWQFRPVPNPRRCYHSPPALPLALGAGLPTSPTLRMPVEGFPHTSPRWVRTADTFLNIQYAPCGCDPPYFLCAGRRSPDLAHVADAGWGFSARWPPVGAHRRHFSEYSIRTLRMRPTLRLRVSRGSARLDTR